MTWYFKQVCFNSWFFPGGTVNIAPYLVKQMNCSKHLYSTHIHRHYAFWLSPDSNSTFQQRACRKYCKRKINMGTDVILNRILLPKFGRLSKQSIWNGWETVLIVNTSLLNLLLLSNSTLFWNSKSTITILKKQKNPTLLHSGHKVASCLRI